MQKKKFDLTSDTVKIALDLDSDNNDISDVSKPKEKVILTIAVNSDIRREFKIWCAENGLKMNEAFVQAFSLLKKEDFTNKK